MRLSCVQGQGALLPDGPLGQVTRYASMTRSSSYFSPSGCNCKRNSRQSGFSFAFWNLKFEFQQQVPGKHRRSCKFFGIDGQTQRRVNAQFPLKLAWMSARMTLASMEYTLGTGSPGCLMFIEAIANPNYSWIRQIGLDYPKDNTMEPIIWCDDSVLATVLRIMQVLDEIVQTDDINVDLLFVPFLWSREDQIGDAHLTRQRGSELVSYWARKQQFDPQGLMDHCVENNTISALHSVPDLMDVMELPPITRAIVSRSVIQLEECILHNPKDVTKRVYGFSTIQFSAGWPEGLRILLNTEARKVIDNGTGDELYWATNLAIIYRCEESLDMLLQAGVRFDIHRWEEMSPECALVAARRLFERRTKLFELAQNQLKDFEGEYTCNTSEEEAECLYNRLVAVGIQVDPSLEVQHGCTTIFHCSCLPLDHFRIFFENGFRNHSAYDELGLTAVMVYRRNLLSDNVYDEIDNQRYLSTLRWLQEEGFLDRSPEDPYNLGLNTNSTGWHYLAAHASIRAWDEDTKMLLHEASRWNAALLDSLTEEFSDQLNMAEPTTKEFNKFLKGYWRSRIEQLDVDEDIVNGMRECLSDVRTHVLPDRVKCFLDFDDSKSEESCTDDESTYDTGWDSSDEDRFEPQLDEDEEEFDNDEEEFGDSEEE
ncbi:hypothetical protein CEP52_009408 [Fusarium oligoseptatum]|uniref:Uncharacterized protein n=1 Tax=Fusarium oligoseptatum TaxID=2604345 RepID=A0A428TD83_9HYPO|nr:hypothetical protein CEP52_009408 [Fusarium oligoseptatum]